MAQPASVRDPSRPLVPAARRMALAPVETTLLELVQALGELTGDDREVVATVVELIRSGRVRLVGSFRGGALGIA